MLLGYQTILKINVLIGEFFKKKRSQNIKTIVYILMYFSY